MVYCYSCDCGNTEEVVRSVEDRNKEIRCGECYMAMVRDYLTETCPEVAVIRDEYTTDFGDGAGHKTYSREDYLTKCKTLGRNPVGMLWQKGEFHLDAEPKEL